MGRKTPLDEMPVFDESDGWFARQEYLLIESIIKAFTRLSFSRPVGMGRGTIVLSEITGYWRNVESLLSELEDWIDMIQSLDNIYLEFHQPQERKKNGT